MNTKLYTQKEVSKILGVTLITVNKWVREGKVKVVYLPTSSRPLITQEELDRLRTPVDKKPY
jgi:predicted site-specific integrase-resolvase